MNDEKPIWIFLSHSSKDFLKVRLIRNYLEEKNCRPLMFYLKCLESEEETLELIKREIDVRQRFVVCDSVNARASKWVDEEIKYITSKDSNRSFVMLDMTKDFDELKKDVDSYLFQMKLFISYTRSALDIYNLNSIIKRLNKYDVSIFDDINCLHPGGHYETQLANTIKDVSKCGYFILLLTDTNISEWQKKEIEMAYKAGAKILAIVTSDIAEEMCLSDYMSRDLIIRVSGNGVKSLTNNIVDEILWRVLPTGSVKTFADNFRLGKNGPKDKAESEKLDALLVRKAMSSSNPAALVFLAECYERGLHGLSIDLHKASMYYSIAIHEEGREDLIPHARELNERLYGNKSMKIVDVMGTTWREKVKIGIKKLFGLG